jgi:hypothetical protein
MMARNVASRKGIIRDFADMIPAMMTMKEAI